MHMFDLYCSTEQEVGTSSDVSLHRTHGRTIPDQGDLVSPKVSGEYHWYPEDGSRQVPELLRS